MTEPTGHRGRGVLGKGPGFWPAEPNSRLGCSLSPAAREHSPTRVVVVVVVVVVEGRGNLHEFGLDPTEEP